MTSILAEEDLPEFCVGLTAPDLSPYLAGNTGIPGFTTRDSGLPGPHAVIVALVHGNELAGAIALAELLAADVPPLHGRLTLGFANLAAFARFNPDHPLASRQVEEDLNRVWDDFSLFGVRRSVELDRAREMRPLIDSADLLLDLHSMLWPSPPLLLCGATARGRALAQSLGTPGLVVADPGHISGKRLIDYGRFTETQGNAAAALLEAGQHWAENAVAQSRASIAAFLRQAGMAPSEVSAPPSDFARVVQIVTARSNRFAFVREFHGGRLFPRPGR